MRPPPPHPVAGMDAAAFPSVAASCCPTCCSSFFKPRSLIPATATARKTDYPHSTSQSIANKAAAATHSPTHGSAPGSDPTRPGPGARASALLACLSLLRCPPRSSFHSRKTAKRIVCLKNLLSIGACVSSGCQHSLFCLNDPRRGPGTRPLVTQRQAHVPKCHITPSITPISDDANKTSEAPLLCSVSRVSDALLAEGGGSAWIGIRCDQRQRGTGGESTCASLESSRQSSAPPPLPHAPERRVLRCARSNGSVGFVETPREI